MKLTNHMRNVFIDAVMADVPQVDYAKQIRELYQSDAVSQLPPKIRAVCNDNALRGYLAFGTRRIHGQYFAVADAHNYKPSEAIIVEGERLEKLIDNQNAKFAELRKKLWSCAHSVKTVKALRDILPEFEKYMPADEAAANKMLPAVQNVAADFKKAGWPAGKAAKK